MQYRKAMDADCRRLAEWNHALIEDEGHRNAMGVTELEERMRSWLSGGGYDAIIFEDKTEPLADALYRKDSSEIYLRQLFVVRHRRRQGIGREAMQTLFEEVWPRGCRLTVSVLVENEAAVAFWREVGYRDYALTLEIRPT